MNYVPKNENQQVHVNIKGNVTTCYSLFTKDPLLSLDFSFIMS